MIDGVDTHIHKMLAGAGARRRRIFWRYEFAKRRVSPGLSGPEALYSGFNALIEDPSTFMEVMVKDNPWAGVWLNFLEGKDD